MKLATEFSDPGEDPRVVERLRERAVACRQVAPIVLSRFERDYKEVLRKAEVLDRDIAKLAKDKDALLAKEAGLKKQLSLHAEDEARLRLEGGTLEKEYKWLQGENDSVRQEASGLDRDGELLNRTAEEYSQTVKIWKDTLAWYNENIGKRYHDYFNLTGDLLPEVPGNVYKPDWDSLVSRNNSLNRKVRDLREDLARRGSAYDVRFAEFKRRHERFRARADKWVSKKRGIDKRGTKVEEQATAFKKEGDRIVRKGQQLLQQRGAWKLKARLVESELDLLNFSIGSLRAADFVNDADKLHESVQRILDSVTIATPDRPASAVVVPLDLSVVPLKATEINLVLPERKGAREEEFSRATALFPWSVRGSESFLPGMRNDVIDCSSIQWEIGQTVQELALLSTLIERQ